MNILAKLQLKILPIKQIVGYASVLLIGSVIVLLAAQLYLDIKPYFTEQSSVLGSRVLVASKQVSVFKTADKSSIYFQEDEIEEIRSQPFVKEVSTFSTAQFEIKGFTKQKDGVPAFYTDLFFEGIPEKYLDLKTDKWDWKESDSLIPIIIPSSYLKLYNFGFAESKNLPVISENTISEMQFGIKIRGRGQERIFKGRIVDFSEKLNSILVPEQFMQWANANYGNDTNTNPSRILIDIAKSDDPKLAPFFESKNIDINKEALEQNKIWFFFQLIFLFLFVIACIIIVLSVAAMLLGFNLMFYKNKSVFNNLYLIGFSNAAMTRYFQYIMLATTTLTLIAAWFVTNWLRLEIREKLENILRLEKDNNLLLFSALLLAVLVVCTVVAIRRSVVSINKSL